MKTTQQKQLDFLSHYLFVIHNQITISCSSGRAAAGDLDWKCQSIRFLIESSLRAIKYQEKKHPESRLKSELLYRLDSELQHFMRLAEERENATIQPKTEKPRQGWKDIEASSLELMRLICLARRRLNMDIKRASR